MLWHDYTQRQHCYGFEFFGLLQLKLVCVLFLICTPHSLALALYVYLNHYMEKCKLLCKCTKQQTLSIITGSQTTNLKKKKSICYPVSQFFTVQSR